MIKKTNFWGNTIDVKPIGYHHLVLKKNNDHFVFSKNKSVVQNIIIGKIHIDHYGDILITNHTTGDTAIIKLLT